MILLGAGSRDVLYCILHVDEQMNVRQSAKPIT